MIPLLLARAPIALLPVLVFLLTLVYFDSFRLVRPRVALSVMAAGAVAAGVSYPLNGALLDLLASPSRSTCATCRRGSRSCSRR